MGMMSENVLIGQLKKGQGETNKRLDQVIVEQQTTNAWLARIASLLEAQQQPAVQPRQAAVYQTGGQGYPPPSGRR